jgi:hypothetical protein
MPRQTRPLLGSVGFFWERGVWSTRGQFTDGTGTADLDGAPNGLMLMRRRALCNLWLSLTTAHQSPETP